MKCSKCDKDVFGVKIQKGTGMCKICWEEKPVARLIVEEQETIDVPKKSFLQRLFQSRKHISSIKNCGKTFLLEYEE